MSNELTISASQFAITRVSKAGKTSVRGLLGLIIEGTPAEREETGVRLAKEAWDAGQLRTVAFELQRVFAGKNWDMAAAFVRLNITTPDKASMVSLMDALVRFYPEAKGVKGKYVKLCQELVEFSNGEAERKEARRLAYEATQAESTVAA